MNLAIYMLLNGFVARAANSIHTIPQAKNQILQLPIKNRQKCKIMEIWGPLKIIGWSSRNLFYLGVCLINQTISITMLVIVAAMVSKDQMITLYCLI